MGADSTVFQPMPPLTEEQYDALRADIAVNGVLVPVTVDQHGRVLDGHNRSAIADDLGIDYPKFVVEVADDEAAMDLAVTLNGARRHLNQEQKRALIEHELIRRPNDSDRAISRRVGCSPTTVGTVRAERRSDAEESVARTHHAIHESYRALFAGCHELMLAGAHPDLLISRAEQGRDEMGARARSAVPNTVEVGVAMIGHNIYTALVNDLRDLVEAVEESGVVFPLPTTMSAEQMDDLLEQIYPLLVGGILLKGVQIGQSEMAGAR